MIQANEYYTTTSTVALVEFLTTPDNSGKISSRSKW
jgi:hypothetical protein